MRLEIGGGGGGGEGGSIARYYSIHYLLVKYPPLTVRPVTFGSRCSCTGVFTGWCTLNRKYVMGGANVHSGVRVGPCQYAIHQRIFGGLEQVLVSLTAGSVPRVLLYLHFLTAF